MLIYVQKTRNLSDVDAESQSNEEGQLQMSARCHPYSTVVTQYRIVAEVKTQTRKYGTAGFSTLISNRSIIKHCNNLMSWGHHNSRASRRRLFNIDFSDLST